MTGSKYDAIIAGARCAGSPLAMLLARRGYRVLLVDRAAFPSEIPHGHFIHRHGPRRLHDWGLLHRVAAICPGVTTQTIDLGDFPLTGRDLVTDGIALGYAPRRALLDKILVDAAVDAGAELRQRCVVEDYVTENDRVTGARLREASAEHSVVERARLIVGADGRNSRLARYVGAATYAAEVPRTFWYFSYWQDVPDDGLEVYVRNGRVVFAFPTSDGLFGVFVGWRRDRLEQVRRAVEEETMSAIDEIPSFAERVRAGRRVERFLGATDVPNFLRVPCGPGWALAGDAGCHKDPFLALGICDAFRDAERLAIAIDDGLSGRAGLDVALREYAADRDASTMRDYQENLEAARLGPFPDDLFRLRAEIRGDAVATRAFYLARQQSSGGTRAAVRAATNAGGEPNRA
jgi:flavin-dependent dehydrogenase